MICPECAGLNSKTAIYCEHCGEALTAAAVAARRERDRREKHMREIELTEAVAMRLKKWGTIFLWSVGVPVAILLFIVGKATYSDIPKAVASAKEEIAVSKNSALSEIASIRDQLPALQRQLSQVQSDATKYQQVNDKIGRLQLGLKRVQMDVVDLGKGTLKAGKVVVADSISAGMDGRHPSLLTMSRPGCSFDEADKGFAYALCVQGSPLALSQMTPDRQVRPIASFSDVGFQDVSTSPKPGCNAALRGTIYVEKGTGNRADQAFLCARKSDGTFRWSQITTVE